MFSSDTARQAGLLAVEMRALLAQLEQVTAYQAKPVDPSFPCSSRGAASTGKQRLSWMLVEVRGPGWCSNLVKNVLTSRKGDTQYVIRSATCSVR